MEGKNIEKFSNFLNFIYKILSEVLDRYWKMFKVFSLYSGFQYLNIYRVGQAKLAYSFREISGVKISGERILVTSLAGSLNVLKRIGRGSFIVEK